MVLSIPASCAWVKISMPIAEAAHHHCTQTAHECERLLLALNGQGSGMILLSSADRSRRTQQPRAGGHRRERSRTSAEPGGSGAHERCKCCVHVMAINQESGGYAPPSVGSEAGDDEEKEIEINIVPQNGDGNDVDAATLNTLPPPNGATSAFASPAATFSSPAPVHVPPRMSRAAPETFSPLHQEASTAPPPTMGLPSVDYSRGQLDNPGPGARDSEPSKLMFMWWMCLAVMMLMTFAIACSAVSMANTNRS